MSAKSKDYEVTSESRAYIRLMNISTHATCARIKLEECTTEDSYVEALRVAAVEALERLRAAAADIVAAADGARSGKNRGEQ